jgi:hypothetical protein
VERLEQAGDAALDGAHRRGHLALGRGEVGDEDRLREPLEARDRLRREAHDVRAPELERERAAALEVALDAQREHERRTGEEPGEREDERASAHPRQARERSRWSDEIHSRIAAPPAK